MQGMLRQVYESAAGDENIRKFELRDLREIINEVGGAAAIHSGTREIRNMFAAAVTPSIVASYASTRTGSTSYSPSVMSSYAAYSTPSMSSSVHACRRW